MKRFVLPLIAIALLACPVLASDLSSARVAKLVKHAPIVRQTGVLEDEIIIPAQIPREMPAHRPLNVRLTEFLERPIKPFVECFESLSLRLRRLIDESEELRMVRDQFHRFWAKSSPAF
jgi:hypothetical protein